MWASRASPARGKLVALVPLRRLVTLVPLVLPRRLVGLVVVVLHVSGLDVLAFQLP